MPALPPGASTALVISAIGLSPYSARGLSQTLEPAAIGVQTRRTVNGALVNLAPAQFAKYKSKVTGNDQAPPAIDGVFPGAAVTVDCVAELSFPTGGVPDRPAVPGSVRIEGAFTYYRPRLEMLVTGFSAMTGEWDAQVGWTVDLEEI
jgi:hypothetical protein